MNKNLIINTSYKRIQGERDQHSDTLVFGLNFEPNKDINYSSNKKSNLLKRIYFLSLFCIKNFSKGMVTLPFFQFKFKDFSSYHLGSSLPMSKKSTKSNKAFTDNLGRLNNNKNIIIVCINIFFTSF